MKFESGIVHTSSPVWGDFFSMSTTQYLSAAGLTKLKQELEEAKTIKRREAAERIEVAKALGDLSENAEYHEAKDALALLEGRIYEIETILKHARVIEDQPHSDRVRIGSTVTVRAENKERVFSICGSNEADPLHGKISNESPIGIALLGGSVGDQVRIQTPGGVVVYTIVAIA